MPIRWYSDRDANKLGGQGGSLRWSIPAQLRRDAGLSDGMKPEKYGIDPENGLVVMKFDELELPAFDEEQAEPIVPELD